MGKSLEFLELDFYDPKQVLIAVSYGSVDFRSIGNRKGTFSKTITMPSTKRNDAFFGMAFDPTNEGNFNSKIRTPITISEIEFTGTLQLRHVTNNGDDIPVSYDVMIFSDLADWASLIGEGSVRELKHHGKHTLSKSSIVDSWSNSGSNGDYVYPMISYGNSLQGLQSTHDIEISFWRPAFFALPLIKQTFKEIGYEFIEKGYVNAGFENFMLPFTSKEVKFTDLRIEAFRHKGDAAYFNNTSKYPASMRKTTGFISELSDFPSNSFDHSAGLFTPPSTDTYDVSVDGYRLFINSTGGKNGGVNGNARLVFTPVGSSAEEFDISPSIDYLESAGKDKTQMFLKGSVSVKLDKDVSYAVAVRFEMNAKTDVFVDFLEGSTPIDTRIIITPRASKLVDGSIISHSRFIQNIKKIDLIKDLINKGNFRVITDTFNKTVEFVSTDKFLIRETEDWTDKVDRLKNSKITLIQDQGSKELNWSYSNDSNDGFLKDRTDSLNVNWGTKSVDLESEYRKGSENVYTSIFSATIDGVGMGLKMPVMSTQDIKQDEPVVRGNFETNFENRCLMYGGLQNGSFTIGGSAKTKYPFCFFVGEDISLHWGNLSEFYELATDIGLIDRNYSTTINKLNNSKLATYWINLSKIDIANLSFRKAKIINGVHYHLNLVDEYIVNGNQSTKVELISK